MRERGPGRGAYGLRRDHSVVTRLGEGAEVGPVPWADRRVSQIAAFSYTRPSDLTVVGTAIVLNELCRRWRRNTTDGISERQRTATRTRVETAQREPLCRRAYTVSCRSSVWMLPDRRPPRDASTTRLLTGVRARRRLQSAGQTRGRIGDFPFARVRAQGRRSGRRKQALGRASCGSTVAPLLPGPLRRKIRPLRGHDDFPAVVVLSRYCGGPAASLTLAARLVPVSSM